MSRIALTAELLAQLREQLLHEKDETCAVLFGRAIMCSGRLARIVVREVLWLKPEDYLKRSAIAAVLRPEIVAGVAQRVRRSRESAIFVHSHPLDIHNFSKIDDGGERVLAEFLGSRAPGLIHAAMLVTPEVTIARHLGSSEELSVIGVGSQIVWGNRDTESSRSALFERQERVFGAVGQRRLCNLRVGVVGLGGTGSVVLEQLTHLGVERLLLIDPDVVEETNLNRLVGASPSDVGKRKVEVAAANTKRINPNARLETSDGSVLLSSVAETLADTDLVFCCTDSHGSRAVLNQLAYQFLVPVIDMGVVIVTSGGQVSHIAGRIQMLSPGLSCLQCANFLNPEAVRVDLMTDFERKADPYIIGIQEPAPAVISLNSTVASMAVTMFLSAVAGVPSTARHLNYNGMTGACRSAAVDKHPTCVVCSPKGALARGSGWDLPARQS